MARQPDGVQSIRVLILTLLRGAQLPLTSVAQRHSPGSTGQPSSSQPALYPVPWQWKHLTSPCDAMQSTCSQRWPLGAGALRVGPPAVVPLEWTACPQPWTTSPPQPRNPAGRTAVTAARSSRLAFCEQPVVSIRSNIMVSWTCTHAARPQHKRDTTGRRSMVHRDDVLPLQSIPTRHSLSNNRVASKHASNADSLFHCRRGMACTPAPESRNARAPPS